VSSNLLRYILLATFVAGHFYANSPKLSESDDPVKLFS